jgi:hypothetical protein
VLLGSGLLQVALTADAVAVVLAVYLADNTKVFEFFLADIERTIEVEVIFARVSHSDLLSDESRYLVYHDSPLASG